MKKKTIAIITARGGSKRIPGKNSKSFCGKPMIAYSIEAAIESGQFDEVMVSTDDEKIKEIALKYGAKVPFMRSEKNSDDFASTVDVLVEVLEDYRKIGMEFDYCCCIYPTAPFVTGEKLKDAMELLQKENAYSVNPIVQFSFPPQRAFCLEDGLIRIKQPEFFSYRSQDLEPLYHDCGQYYCLQVAQFLEKKTLISDRTLPVILPESEVQDIDVVTDWEIAEMKYKLMVKGEANENRE